KAAPISEQAEGVVVTIDKKGGIYINDVWSRLENFETNLKKELEAKNSSSVFLRADSMVFYGQAIEIIGRLKDIGIEEIGLITAHHDKQKSGKSKK
ncbi:MAG: ExbD/TolR family protein, partial [Candidatus Zixiibacteriota bacterium]